METYGIHLFVYHILFYFFFRQPTFVRKSVLQFISVELCFLGTEDRRNFRKFDFSDAGKVVRYLFLLVLDLLRIGKNLPFATATYAIMLAKWDSSFTRIFVELHCYSFSIMMLFSLNLQVYYISGNDIRYENNQIINLCDGFSFGSHIRYCHFLQ